MIHLSGFVLLKTYSDKWNKELEQTTEELYEDGWCTSQTTVVSR